MNTVFGDIISEIVCRAVIHTRLDACACYPHREAAWMMIAAIIITRQLALGIIGAAEFTAPNDQRILQQSVRFQVGDERITGGTGGRNSKLEVRNSKQARCSKFEKNRDCGF